MKSPSKRVRQNDSRKAPAAQPQTPRTHLDPPSRLEAIALLLRLLAERFKDIANSENGSERAQFSGLIYLTQIAARSLDSHFDAARTNTSTSHPGQARKGPDAQTATKTFLVKKPRYGNGHPGAVSLLLHNHRTGKTDQVELLPALFEDVKREASKVGWTPLKLISQIVHDEIWRAGDAATDRKVLGDFRRKS